LVSETCEICLSFGGCCSFLLTFDFAIVLQILFRALAEN
jgi:hypothetical protein